ncbi:IclR family transcriptional regulator [Roseomonas marmotae]|uniref:IclR family transcriptional regulator n=1 Tax=Roseomonas marmotae TaxID=2768161 RepID=A0ABS3KFJ7_9PROT|nr:IclR family transcriptional regulator [Roseomonas marmotae]MBO1076197.1 IclR family transcriptional regulator [Roseomonas marmotae]QTI81767.1 IclR family transcriptional regulator [Roseomonas marmotae]
MDYTIAAVDRALALLEVVAETPGVGLSELARLTGSTKTLAFRMATTLEARGYLLKDCETRGYTLGYKPLLLSERMQHQMPLLRVAKPVLDDLMNRTRENVSLLVRDDLQTVCIGIRQSPQPIRLYAELGRQGPLHVGGGPKLLLAFAPEEVQEAVLTGLLERFTPETITDAGRLRALLVHIRERGYNISHGDQDAGAFSIAAPVRDHSGQVVASISVAGPQSRLTGDLERLYIRMIVNAGAEISALLGWRDAAA